MHRAAIGLIASALFAGACADGADQVEPLDNDALLLSEPATNERGLLASAGFEGQPFKGVYFFPGEVSEQNQKLFTATPVLADDMHWNSEPSARQRVVQRIAATHANTIVMSYWGDEMRRWSPMALDDSSVPGTLAAVSGEHLLVVPSLESGYEPGSQQYWRFSDDFPYKDAIASAGNLAPKFIARLRAIVDLYRANTEPGLSAWAQLYDRDGRPRFVVQIMHVYAHAVPDIAGKTADEIVAEAFDSVAAEIARTEGIDIGFLLDVIPGAANEYTVTPAAGPALNRTSSVLAIAGFIPEIFSGRVVPSQPNAPPIDNNTASLDALLSYKRSHIEAWVSTGVPVIFDVSSGYDGRFVWADRGTFFWGDNYDYTFDDWRNALSAGKGRGTLGITFNTWNGFTEGFAAVPTREHGDTIQRWLTDLYEPDPRVCSHVEYVDGAPGVKVEGAICSKWSELGASRGVLGAPRQAQATSARGTVVHFAHGSIFSADVSGTHALHGAIHALYQELGFDASCLGLPTSDAQALASPDSWIAHFEGGDIIFEGGSARSQCN